MLHLLKIDLAKLTNYRTFWVICGLYFFTLAIVTASGMEVLKWVANTFGEFGASININRIPIYHFPDVWQNLVYVSGLFKIILAIMVTISVTNEYQYRTIRQNIIDGMSRWEYIQSKIFTNVLLSLVSVALVFFIALITGMIYSPELVLNDMLTDLEFFPAYFLEVFSFLSFALMIGILIQRSGLTIVVLLLARFIEFIFKVRLPESADWVKPFLPMESISNLVHWPFPRYALQEIQDYVSVGDVLIGLAWIVLFNYFAYLKLKKADI